MNRSPDAELLIGSVIKSLRLAKNITQHQLAADLGINRSAIAQWESGNSNPRVAILNRLADSLGVEVGALLSDRPMVPRSVAVQVIQAWELWDESPTESSKDEFVASIMHLSDAINLSV